MAPDDCAISGFETLAELSSTDVFDSEYLRSPPLIYLNDVISIAHSIRMACGEVIQTFGLNFTAN